MVFDELDKDYLDVEEDTWATLLDIDFLDQDLLPDILKQLNEELKKEMEREENRECLFVHYEAARLFKTRILPRK